MLEIKFYIFGWAESKTMKMSNCKIGKRHNNQI